MAYFNYTVFLKQNVPYAYRVQINFIDLHYHVMQFFIIFLCGKYKRLSTLNKVVKTHKSLMFSFFMNSLFYFEENIVDVVIIHRDILEKIN